MQSAAIRCVIEGAGLMLVLHMSGTVSAQGQPSSAEVSDAKPQSHPAPPLALGPIAGLTTAWHPAPAQATVPLGASIIFQQPAPPEATVDWSGAVEYARDAEGSWAFCRVLHPSNPVTVEVDVPGSPLEVPPPAHWKNSCELLGLASAVAVDPIDVTTTPVIDPDSITTAETMGLYFAAESIAGIVMPAADHCVTSIARPVNLQVKVTPDGFAPLVEWRVDGAVVALGPTTTLSFGEPGSRTIEAGPPESASVLRFTTYAVSIASAPDSTWADAGPLDFAATTDPPGFESYVTWIAADKHGQPTPLTGSGPAFNVAFAGSFGPTGSVGAWMGVRADNAALGADEGPEPPPPPPPPVPAEVVGGAFVVFQGQPGEPTVVFVPNLAAAGEDLDEEPVIVVPKISSMGATAVLADIQTQTIEFVTLGEFATGDEPAQAATGDFEDDGADDVLVANRASGSLSVLKGAGDGTFGAPTTVAVGGNPEPVALVIADLDLNTEEDAIVAGSLGVSTLLGNGAGGFTPFGFTPVSDLTGLDVDTIDGGLVPDVLAVSGAPVFGTLETGFATVLLGTGAGGLTPAGTFAAGEAIAAGLLEDFDQDGAVDALLAVHSFEGTAPPVARLLLFLGNGAGGFAASGVFPGITLASADGILPSHGAVADLDNDTFPDAVFTSSESIAYAPGTFADSQPPLTLTLLVNDGAGGFELRTEATAYVGRGVTPVLAHVGPDPLDTFIDVILVWTTDELAGSPVDPLHQTFVAILFGDGAGGFEDPAEHQLDSGEDSGSGDSGDVDSDATALAAAVPPKLDLVVPNAAADTVTVLLGDGLGGVQDTLTVSDVDDLDPGSLPPGEWTGGPYGARLGHLNTDGRLDLVVYNLWRDASLGDLRASLSAFLGDGLGGFAKSDYQALARGGEFALADVDVDGKLDAVTTLRFGPGTEAILAVWKGDGLGGLAATSSNKTPPPGFTLSGGLAVANVDSDARPDILTTVTDLDGDGFVLAWLNAAGGPAGFLLTPKLTNSDEEWTSVTDVGVGDFDGEGSPDVVVATAEGKLALGLGSDDGFFSFDLLESLADDLGGGRIAIGEMNGDFSLDLVCANGSSSGAASVVQMFGDGDGDFSVALVPGLSATNSGEPLRPLLADMNNDETTDLVLVHGKAGTVSVLPNALYGFSTYGPGKPGKGGILPKLAGKGYTTPGGLMRLVVTDGVGGAPCQLNVGLGQLTSGFLAVQLVLLKVPLVLGGPAGVPGAGTLNLPAIFPDDESFIGLELTMQLLIKDVNAGQPGPKKIAATNGLLLEVK